MQCERGGWRLLLACVDGSVERRRVKVGCLIILKTVRFRSEAGTNLEALTQSAKTASAMQGCSELPSSGCRLELGVRVRVRAEVRGPRPHSLHGVARAARRGTNAHLLRSRKRQERESRAGRGPGAAPLSRSICAGRALVVSDDETCRPARCSASPLRQNTSPAAPCTCSSASDSHAARPRVFRAERRRRPRAARHAAHRLRRASRFGHRPPACAGRSPDQLAVSASH